MGLFSPPIPICFSPLPAVPAQLRRGGSCSRPAAHTATDSTQRHPEWLSTPPSTPRGKSHPHAERKDRATEQQRHNRGQQWFCLAARCQTQCIQDTTTGWDFLVQEEAWTLASCRGLNSGGLPEENKADSLLGDTLMCQRRAWACLISTLINGTGISKGESQKSRGKAKGITRIINQLRSFQLKHK